MNPWQRACGAQQREATYIAVLNAASAEVERLTAERDATQRLLAQAEDIIRDLQRQAQRPDLTRLRVELAIKDDVITALEERLAQAQKAQLACDREHGPLVRVRQLVERDAP